MKRSYDRYIISRKATDAQYEKFDALLDILTDLGKPAVAFSGGVDSTFLLRAARIASEDAREGTASASRSGDALANSDAVSEPGDTPGEPVAITVDSDFVPAREGNEAADICRCEGVPQIVLQVASEDIEGFSDNPPDRCYICKKYMFTKIKEAAASEGCASVIEGSNTDDAGDYRPGRRALSELGIKSPMQEAGLSKEDIRALSKDMGLETWNKPSFACLASRFEYGQKITEEKLRMVEAAEQSLFDMGLAQVRVRVHGLIARIEVPEEDIEKLAGSGTRKEITERFRALGFAYTALDLEGYRTGSMNEVL